MKQELLLNIIPSLIPPSCFIVLMITIFYDMLIHHKIHKLLKEYYSLGEIVSQNDFYVRSVLEEALVISKKVSELNIHRKKSIKELRDIISDFEIILIPYDSDLAIKIRQRNIKAIIK